MVVKRGTEEFIDFLFDPDDDPANREWLKSAKGASAPCAGAKPSGARPSARGKRGGDFDDDSN